jgi:hypothetical protein
LFYSKYCPVSGLPRDDLAPAATHVFCDTFVRHAPDRQEVGFGIGRLAAQYRASVNSIAKPSQMKTMPAIMV